MWRICRRKHYDWMRNRHACWRCFTTHQLRLHCWILVNSAQTLGQTLGRLRAQLQHQPSESFTQTPTKQFLLLHHTWTILQGTHISEHFQGKASSAAGNQPIINTPPLLVTSSQRPSVASKPTFKPQNPKQMMQQQNHTNTGNLSVHRWVEVRQKKNQLLMVEDDDATAWQARDSKWCRRQIVSKQSKCAAWQRNPPIVTVLPMPHRHSFWQRHPNPNPTPKPGRRAFLLHPRNTISAASAQTPQTPQLHPLQFAGLFNHFIRFRHSLPKFCDLPPNTFYSINF